MVSLATAGFRTTTGANVCFECGADSALLQSFRLGACERPIVKPSHQGQYVRTPLAAGYDAPCDICGWAIREAR